MTNHMSDSPCDKNRESIPWYVNGTLADSESEALKQHIAGCDVCRADVELHASMRNSILGRELTPITPVVASHDILDSHPRVRRRDHSHRPIAVAAGVAVLAVALIVSIFRLQITDDLNQTFETATSGEQGARIDYVLQVQFEENVSDERRRLVIQQLNNIVQWSVTDAGGYELHIQLDAPSLSTLHQYEERVGAIEGVESAEFTALQLPMR